MGDYSLGPPDGYLVTTAVLSVFGFWKVVDLLVWAWNHLHWIAP